MTTSAQLVRRFPGILDAIGRAVADGCDIEDNKPKARAWHDIRIAPHGGYQVWLHGRAPWLDDIILPLIPDEHNPRPDKFVKPTDKPYTFYLMSEAHEAGQAYARKMQEFIAQSNPIKTAADQTPRRRLNRGSAA